MTNRNIALNYSVIICEQKTKNCAWSGSFQHNPHRGGSRIFLGGGALVSCSTSTPINNTVFFWQNTSCIRKRQVISGGGGAQPLHPPPRSAPATAPLFSTLMFAGFPNQSPKLTMVWSTPEVCRARKRRNSCSRSSREQLGSFSSGDGNENDKMQWVCYAKQLCTCITLFCAFLCRHCTTVKMPDFTLYGGRQQATTNFSFSF